MAEPAASADDLLTVEEARLARAAAAGDGDAFATLYERYARRAYNLSVRLCGSDEDAADAVQEAFLKVMRRLPEISAREFAFGSYLFTATRNSTYDLMRAQQRTRPTDSIPESATPLGAGAGGLGLDPGDPDEDPDRRLLMAAQGEEIEAANARLPERQREALALRELEDLSYDEIAVTMGMNRNSVAQLISRARINLREEMRGGALASIATASADCERALPLIAMRDDRQLDPGSADAAWLASHLGGCDRCAVATAVMQEAGVSYRAWIPVAVAPWLFHETVAKAAELSGSDWTEVARRRGNDSAAAAAGLPPAYRGGTASADSMKRRGRRTAVLAGLSVLLVALVVAAFAVEGDDSLPPTQSGPRIEEAAAPTDSGPSSDSVKKKAEPRPKPSKRAAEAAPAEAPVPSSTPVDEVPLATPTSSPPDTTGTESEAKPDRSSGGSGAVDAPQSVAVPKPEAKPEPEIVPEPTPEPTPEVVTPPVEEPPVEVPPTRPPRGEPPRQPPAGSGPRG